ncbi:PREDICTED: tRNA-specific adenosine deaminase 2 [Nicrophorus vespilloides]|uniref:tRNA-specific adenosine deaminase 2 n=1 Tax=Nicrophorus vespilloides TaxID=110193 RepID=A0ABM1NGH0_NICVS|nr:PREDICTED: tRNA-specific adenosine deaminase 2 [Nicrophorus vespilloides]XP_017785920.1 PREDICTED: tRNA-specific adenosine deaminase 2 [Nicrophorus vespilloides]
MIMDASVLSDDEKKFMDEAFKYAQEALEAQEVPVGCIFIYENEIIALGRNEVNRTRNATRHAEIICIDQVNEYAKKNGLDLKSVLAETSVYVTVEPCIMCAAALYNVNIKSIIFGCQNDRFGGQTVFDVAKVLGPKTTVKGGFRAEEAMGLLKEFYKGTNPSAPSTKVKTKGKKM